MNLIRVAVIQAAPVAFDRAKTLDRVRDLAADAAARDVRLSCFPRRLSPDIRAESISAQGRFANSRRARAFSPLLGKRGRRAGPGDRHSGAEPPRTPLPTWSSAWSSATVARSTARSCFSHRRPAHGQASQVDAHRRGAMLRGARATARPCPFFQRPIGRLGAVICWENYMPLLRMHMYAQGIQIYCAPTADDRDTWIATMRHVALEGRCFVLSCNQFALRGDYPHDYPAIQGNDPAAVMSRGGSCIIDPLGQIVAGPDYSGPTTLVAELDLDEVTRGKFDFDVVGHYARPDVFRLVVDENERKPVVRHRTPAE